MMPRQSLVPSVFWTVLFVQDVLTKPQVRIRTLRWICEISACLVSIPEFSCQQERRLEDIKRCGWLTEGKGIKRITRSHAKSFIASALSILLKSPHSVMTRMALVHHISKSVLQAKRYRKRNASVHITTIEIMNIMTTFMIFLKSRFLMTKIRW